MKLGLAITNDWELFGDGSGDFFEVQHDPMREMLRLLKEHRKKITIMAEIGQQFAHRELGKKEKWAREIVYAWENLLRDAVRQRSDVQLHFHPQWLKCSFEDGRWQMNMDNWSLSSLDEKTIKKVLGKGKRYLENMLKPVYNKYKCVAFRTGGFCIQPSEQIVSALKQIGMAADTSVVPGTYSEGFYDFRKAYSNILPWRADFKEITHPSGDPKAILEFPVYTKKVVDSQVMKRFTPELYYKTKFDAAPANEEIEWQKERKRIKEERYPSSQRFYKKNEKKNLSWIKNAIFSERHIPLNYDDLPATTFVSMLEEIFEDPALARFKETDISFPVIAIGHIKDIHNVDNMRWIIEKIEDKMADKVEFWALRDLVFYWRKQMRGFEDAWAEK